MFDINAFDMTPYGLLQIGHQGENLARRVVFDLTPLIAEFGEGSFVYAAKRPGETAVYPAANTEREGSFAVWNLTATDTALAGSGRAELRYYVGEVLCKTIIWETVISVALGPTGPAPDPIEDYIDEMHEIAEEAQGYADAAETSADRAEQAAKDAGYMFFYIDENGDLIYQRTSNVQVDFYLNDGDLYVRAST